jgi:hypothetical protein
MRCPISSNSVGRNKGEEKAPLKNQSFAFVLCSTYNDDFRFRFGRDHVQIT